MLNLVRQSDCAQAREAASARLDCELSELEAARFELHLRDCAECRAYAHEIETITAGLRAAPLERPKTSTLLAFRAAGVLGTFAHAWANGAAASVEARVLPATLVVAVADTARTITAAPTPTRSQRRLCIDSLRICVRRELPSLRRRLLAPRPRGVPSRT